MKMECTWSIQHLRTSQIITYFFKKYYWKALDLFEYYVILGIEWIVLALQLGLVLEFYCLLLIAKENNIHNISGSKIKLYQLEY